MELYSASILREISQSPLTLKAMTYEFHNLDGYGVTIMRTHFDPTSRSRRFFKFSVSIFQPVAITLPFLEFLLELISHLLGNFDRSCFKLCWLNTDVISVQPIFFIINLFIL